MMNTTINASIRADKGKGSSRRLRHQNKLPSIVYGANKPPMMITLDAFAMEKLFSDEATFTRIMELNIGSEKEQVIIKDLQRHPARKSINHIDFLRVDGNQRITIRIPINFVNQENSKALSIGAILNRFLSTVEVSCLAKDLPETIDIDVSRLKLGDTLRLSNIKMPAGVAILALTHGDVDAYDQTVVSLSKARKMTDVIFDDDEDEAVEEGEGDAVAKDDAQAGDK